ncbi:hypothetical protein FACS189447_09490 [Spirochaetia bacterium]|nr:hypothetical protein FACS189447_09490 [Spirochaetia bacterium]
MNDTRQREDYHDHHGGSPADPWNSHPDRDDQTKPWNDPAYRDDPNAAWNSPGGGDRYGY